MKTFLRSKLSCFPLWLLTGVAASLCGLVGLFSMAAGASGLPRVNTPASPTPTSVVNIAPTAAITPTETPIPTQAPTPTPTPTPSLQSQASQVVGGANLTGKVKNVAEDSGLVTVNDDIGDGNLTNGLTVTEIKSDCFNAQQALWKQLGDQISEVDVNVYENVVDQYGNTSNQSVAHCALKKATEQQFNWDNLDYDQAWNNNDYDSEYIASFLTQ